MAVLPPLPPPGGQRHRVHVGRLHRREQQPAAQEAVQPRQQNKPEPAGYGGSATRTAPWAGGGKTSAGLLGSYLRHLDAVELRMALHIVLKISEVGNDSAQAANRSSKSDEDECGASLHTCLNLIHLVAALLRPFPPDTAESIARRLGVEAVLVIPDTFNCDSIRPGHKLGEAEHLFTRIRPDPRRPKSGRRRAKNGKKGGKVSAAPGISKCTESGDGKKPRAEQDGQRRTEASLLDGSTAVGCGLRPFSFE